MTVCSLIQSWRPISRFESPRATASRTAVSRSLRTVAPGWRSDSWPESPPQTVNDVLESAVRSTVARSTGSTVLTT